MKAKTAQITKLSEENTDILENQKINELKTKVKQNKDIKSFAENSTDFTDIKAEENTELETEINKRLTKRKDEDNKTVHVCTVCDKEGSKKQKIRQHIETHLEGFSHKCHFCDVVKHTRGSLAFHEWQYHKGPNA